MKDKLVEYCKYNDEISAVKLIASGHSISKCEYGTGQIAAHIAAGHGLKLVIQAMCARPDFEPQTMDVNGMTPIDCAYAQGHYELAEVMSTYHLKSKNCLKPPSIS